MANRRECYINVKCGDDVDGLAVRELVRNALKDAGFTGGDSGGGMGGFDLWMEPPASVPPPEEYQPNTNVQQALQ